mgnify:CR=1 FL=1
MTNRRFVGLSRLTAIVACIACANPAPVVAQSLAEDDRRLAEFVEQLSGDERPIAQLVGLLLNKEESAQDLAAEKLAQRSDLPDGALALLAMKVCLEGGFLAPPAFCGDKPLAEALWATDHSNEFNLSIACWFSRSPRESADGGIPNSAEKSCADFTTPTRFDDHSQELKSFLIQALDEHHVLDNANLSPYSELPVMSKISSSVFFAEMVLYHVYDELNRHVGCDSRAVMLSVPDAEWSKQLDAGFLARAQRMLATGGNSLPTVQCAESILVGLKDPKAIHRQSVLIESTYGNSVIYSKDSRTIDGLAKVILLAARSGDAAAWPEFVKLLEQALAEAARAKSSEPSSESDGQ